MEREKPESPSGSAILMEKNGIVGTVTISNPGKRNPIGTRQAEEIADALSTLDADDAVRVVVVTGAGEAFSAGGDLDEFLGTVDAGPTALWETGGPWERLYSLPRRMRKPTIARVAGPAVAGGCGLVAACDFAIAADTAIFATPEIAIGLFPLFILPGMIAAVGRRNALDLALTARRIDAAEALSMGLVGKVVPRDRLDAEVAALAAQLGRIAPAGMARGKHAFEHISRLGFEDGLEVARGIRGAFMGSQELRDGIGGFLKKQGDGR